ncbi:hypothetical protein BDR05DRAFT_958182 [Suillus weaverae]|nr:hypothetical protein BDR05DRAFT_958182 [Suillus weaverae]
MFWPLVFEDKDYNYNAFVCSFFCVKISLAICKILPCAAWTWTGRSENGSPAMAWRHILESELVTSQIYAREP